MKKIKIYKQKKSTDQEINYSTGGKIRVILSIFLFLALILLTLFIKGRPQGNSLYYQDNYDTALGGPFEQSISAGRFALTASIALHHSLTLTENLAKFSAPDVVYYKERFISVFTPGISFLGVPFYILGQLTKLPQIFTYLPILFISIVNTGLIMILSKKLGTNSYIGIFVGFVFLFATNALPYAFTFTQHAVSTMLVLLSLINATQKSTFMNNLFLGIIVGISPLIDIPILILIAPILIYTVAKNFYKIHKYNKLFLYVKLNILGILLGSIPFIFLFGWYNYTTIGSPLKIAQLIGNTNYFSTSIQNRTIQTSAPTKSEGTLPSIGVSIPFQTRNLLNGIYILLFSNERAWIFYCPIVFFGILGIWKTYKFDATNLTKLSLAIILMDILLYAMFGDPWGGWNFGPRYLIPSAAILCIFIGPIIHAYKKNIFFIFFLTIFLIYSIWVNEMGALTTISIPPKLEVLALQKTIPYTYAYNQQLLQNNFSSSLIYNLLLKKLISPVTFLYIILILTTLLFTGLYLVILAKKYDKTNE